MKLLIASDIHGSAFWCGRLLAEIQKEQPDRVILLGDLLYHGPRNDLPRDYAPGRVIPMLSGLKDRIIAVRGNCEAEVDQMVLPFPCMADYAQLLVDGTLFHLSHGHHQNPEALPPLPEGSVFLFGHTHVKLDKTVAGVPPVSIRYEPMQSSGAEAHSVSKSPTNILHKDGIRCLNPGSVSIPKDGSHSCLIYENGNFYFKILEE